MVKNSKMKRNYNIDFFRGFAALSIIFIHTVFWSGERYAPDWIRSAALLIDVPLFIFISGMTYNFSNSTTKTIKSILKLWKTYILFLVIFFFITFLIDRANFTIPNIFKSFFFIFPASSRLYVVGGSIWFIFMFFTVSLLGSIIISLYNKYFKSLGEFKYIILFVFLIYGMKLYFPSFFFFDIQTLFYLFIYLLGYYLYKYKIDLRTFIILEISIISILYLLLRFGDYNFLDMQTAKLTYNINYLIYSLISIIAVSYFKDVVNFKKKNVLTYVGENALLFYFCQGLGASFIYEFLECFKEMSVSGEIFLMFVLNLFITIAFVFILKGMILAFNKLEILLKRKRFFSNMLHFESID